MLLGTMLFNLPYIGSHLQILTTANQDLSVSRASKSV